jgi:hexosaminidase
MTREVELLQYFELDLLDRVVHTYRKRPIVWQDVFDSGLQGIPDTTILDIWKDWIMDESLYNATIANYDVVFSACWYLDHLNEDWWSFYTCNPREITNMTSNQQSHILGGHTSMWGENVDSTNFFERVWPRSSATAEVLWSGRTKNVTISFNEVQARLERFRCYMLQQFDIPVSPIAPDHCQSHGPFNFKVKVYESNDALRIPLDISVQ